MSARYAYFYFMGTDADRVRATAPAHAAYWRDLGLDDYVGGPFEDRGGGLITFRVDSAAQADSAVAADPFVTTGLLERIGSSAGTPNDDGMTPATLARAGWRWDDFSTHLDVPQPAGNVGRFTRRWYEQRYRCRAGTTHVVAAHNSTVCRDVSGRGWTS